MLSTHIRGRTANPALFRALAIVGFMTLTALGARLTVPLFFSPVPVTLQVLTVLLAGLVLGAKDGALSQVLYLAAISGGLPLDANGLGPGVWATPTAGYLLGFVAGAYLTGLLAEKGLRRSRGLRLLAGVAGVAVIYLTGSAWLTFGFLNGDWASGWALGIAPFLLVDLAKALIAAGLAEGVLLWLSRAGGGRSDPS